MKTSKYNYSSNNRNKDAQSQRPTVRAGNGGGYTGNRRVYKKKLDKSAYVLIAIIVLIAAALVTGCIFLLKSVSNPQQAKPNASQAVASAVNASQAPGKSAAVSDSASPSASAEPSANASVQSARVDMQVAAVDSTKPSVYGLKTNIFVGTQKVSSYNRANPINFGRGSEYTKLEGIITFRGNNYREGASYGTAEVSQGTLESAWHVPTGSVPKSGGKGSWTGSGWTGQPLIIKWPEDIKKIMNLYPAKKADPNLIEVIYPCLDGKIYFLDLKDGSATRPAIKTGGGPTKGTCSLYPDGTPMLFVGQGDALPGGVVKYRIYNLINQQILYTFGTNDPNKYRKWEAYDSSAMIDAKTDTLIEPGENGILYTIKLNTKFDKAAGKLSINPDKPVKFNYTSQQYGENKRWWGIEDSCAIYKNYAYMTDNGGKLMCIDLNTMKLIWAQNTLDDSNSTPLFEESPKDNTCYLYTSTSLHFTSKGSGIKGTIPIWKINAATGEIVWKTPFMCYTVSGVSGGVEGTGVLGKNDISDLVIYPVARTPSQGSGILVALDKKDGSVRWKVPMKHYLWSSPVAVYTKEGKSYIVQCDTQGNMFLIEGKTGHVLKTINLGGNIEASPAVYGNTIVVGTRRQKIYAVTIK